jgi:RNA polymerase sigma factor (TIGR02999 family)
VLLEGFGYGKTSGGDMAESDQHDVTRLLKAWSGGDSKALDELFPIVYTEVRKLARSYLRRERPDHTLQPTALVNEAYMRLVDQRHVDWQNRAHFFGIAAQVMRRVLVDHARMRQADKRGSGERPVVLDEALALVAERTPDVVALDDALRALAELDPRQAQIVELRFFGGLSIEEAAEVIGLSPATVKREWSAARAWLRRELERR